MQEDIVPEAVPTIEPVKPTRSFLKRYWWVLVLVGTVSILFLIFLYLKDKAENSQYADKGQYTNENKKLSQQDPRIVATFTPDSKAAFQYNSPTIANDFIYVGTSSKVSPEASAEETLNSIHDNFFYKMDLELHPVWSYSLGKTMTQGAAVLDSQNNIYFTVVEYFKGTPDPMKNKRELDTQIFLMSLTPEGTFRWKKDISGGKVSWNHGMINPAIGTDDTIYVGESKLFAFDTLGNIKWQYPKTNTIRISNFRSSPIIDKANNVYFISPEPVPLVQADFGSESIRLYKFNGATGKLVWSTLLGNNVLLPEGGTNNGGGQKENIQYSTPAFTTGESSVYAVVGNTINRVNATTGKQLWSFKPEGITGSIKSSPVVDANDNLYVGNKSNTDSNFYAVKADGSGLLWKKFIGADMYPAPFLGDDNKVYVGSEGTEFGHLHAIDIATGNIIWNTGMDKTIPDFSFGSPILYKGYIYCGVYAVVDGAFQGNTAFFKVKADADGYLSGSPWPRIRGNNLNNGRSQ